MFNSSTVPKSLTSGYIHTEKHGKSIFVVSHSNTVFNVKVDSKDCKWFATVSSVTKYDGKIWYEYDNSNSDFPDVTIGGSMLDSKMSQMSILDKYSNFQPNYQFVLDRQGVLWLSTIKNCYNCVNSEFIVNITRFSGEKWTKYTDTIPNSSKNYTINSIACDTGNSVWLGTYSGAIKFDGEAWTYFDSLNSSLPGNVVYSAISDKSGIMWFGTNNGLARFDGKDWIVFNVSNSGLPGDIVTASTIDKEGNLWFGTDGGLAKYEQDRQNGQD